MTEGQAQFRTPDGVASGVLYRGAGGAARPGVVYLTDIWGIRPAERQKAQRIADAGYTVLMPNIFYRTGEPPFVTTPVDFNDPKIRQKFAELSGPLTPDAMHRDVAAYVDFLSVLPATAPGPLGAVGNCLSGQMALRAAAARPDKVRAVASFHGGGLYTDKPDSPHLLLPKVKARLYFAHAEGDRSMPLEAIQMLDRALAAWGGVYESEVYAGNRHGWTTPDHSAYDEAGADRAFAKLQRLLAHLAPAGTIG